MKCKTFFHLQVSAILYKTTGDIEPVENDKFSVTAMNTTFDVSMLS